MIEIHQLNTDETQQLDLELSPQDCVWGVAVDGKTAEFLQYGVSAQGVLQIKYISQNTDDALLIDALIKTALSNCDITVVKSVFFPARYEQIAIALHCSPCQGGFALRLDDIGLSHCR